MAKMMSQLWSRRHWAEAFGAASDKRMSPRAMDAYLQYRLYLMDAQIEALLRKLRTSGRGAADHCVWCKLPLSDESCASWTSLNYLLNSREALWKTLSSGDRGTV